MNKYLIWALIINFLLAIGLGGNFLYKYSHNGVGFFDSPIVHDNPVVSTTVLPKEKIKTPVVTNITKQSVIPKSLPIAADSSCVMYGPVNNDNKTILDLLFKKSNILEQAVIVNKPVYEIVWTLGKNKVTAIELFERQKNGGPLQNEKFKIKLDKTGEWLVPIAEIIADENNAARTTKELSEKAINIGGKWEYRIKDNTYFYQFKESNVIPTDVKEVIKKTLSLPLAHC